MDDLTNSIDLLLHLIDPSARVIHGPASGRGDWDCIASSSDPAWVLRIPEPWRAVQVLDHDITARQWFISHDDGTVVVLDVLIDPRGIGKDRFPTRGMAEQSWPREIVEAVYLTAKRLRKRDRQRAEWASVRALAKTDSASYRRACDVVFGRWGKSVARSVLTEEGPDPGVFRAARLWRAKRVFWPPQNAIVKAGLHLRRWLHRASAPTGARVLLVGPDGTGKSTVAEALASSVVGFRATHRRHWRPGFLPRPGRLAGKPPADATAPHRREPFGRMTSGLLLLYYWSDFLVGDWIDSLIRRRRSQLVINERGWWDIAVDPARYRLQVASSLVGALGRLLPRPDAVLLLTGDPEVITRRKAELTAAEVSRQAAEWRAIGWLSSRMTIVDTSELDAHKAAAEASSALLDMMETRVISRSGTGWVSLPPRGTWRWLLPRGPRHRSSAATSLYTPTTSAARVAWDALRQVSRLGLLRILPRSGAPPPVVRRALAMHLERSDTLAVMRPSQADRLLAGLISDRHLTAVAKIATSAEGTRVIAHEARTLRENLGLPEALQVPRVLASTPRMILLEAVPHRRQRVPWHLDPVLAEAMGELSRPDPREPTRYFAHGDFAPWNLLENGEGWTLIDWEHSGFYPPYFDMLHFLVQCHVLLGRPRTPTLLEGLNGHGTYAPAIAAFARGARVEEPPANFLEGYLQATESRTRDAKARAKRDALRARLGTSTI